MRRLSRRLPGGLVFGGSGTASVKIFGGSFLRKRLEHLRARLRPAGPSPRNREPLNQLAHAHVRVVHQLPVHPLEVERQPDRLAHAQSLNLSRRVLISSPGSRRHSSTAARRLHQLAAIELLADVDPRPFARGEHADVIELAGLERFGLRRVVLVDLVGHAVEVVHAAAHAEVARPVVGIALVGDVVAEFQRPMR